MHVEEYKNMIGIYGQLLICVVDVEFHPNPNFISSTTNQMSHQATMPTKPFHNLIIYMWNNPNIHIILFSCILVINKTVSHSTCVVVLT